MPFHYFIILPRRYIYTYIYITSWLDFIWIPPVESSVDSNENNTIYEPNMEKTRLDRLLLLLDTGSTRAHREMAAEEIGAIVKMHPEDLQQIMCRVHHFLRSKSFETRMAAGYAFKFIASNVVQVCNCNPITIAEYCVLSRFVFNEIIKKKNLSFFLLVLSSTTGTQSNVTYFPLYFSFF